MIELPPHALLMVYLFATSMGILAIWCWHHFISKELPRLDQREELHLCEYCQYIYMSASDQKVNTCPQCGQYNKHNRFKKE
jgi:uncharacterized paraquat-inducible protein A